VIPRAGGYRSTATNCQRSFLRSGALRVAVRIFFCGMEELYGPMMLRIQNKLGPGLEVTDLGNVRDARSAWENTRTNLLVETKAE
jgi:hypothetical protein